MDLDPAKPIKPFDSRERTRLWLALTQADLKLAACEGFEKAAFIAGLPKPGGVRAEERND